MVSGLVGDLTSGSGLIKRIRRLFNVSGDTV